MILSTLVLRALRAEARLVRLKAPKYSSAAERDLPGRGLTFTTIFQVLILPPALVSITARVYLPGFFVICSSSVMISALASFTIPSLKLPASPELPSYHALTVSPLTSYSSPSSNSSILIWRSVSSCITLKMYVESILERSTLAVCMHYPPLISILNFTRHKVHL